MRFPSIGLVLSAARASAVRFPLVLLSAGVAAAAAITIAHTSGDHRTALRFLVSAQLGLPLLFALAMYAERRGWSVPPSITVQGVGVLLLGAYFVAWPQWSDTVAATRHAQLNLALHLLVAFLPFVGLRELNGFWQYNRALFLRFLTAVLFSGVLYAGLAIALAAIDRLLGIHVDEDTYLDLWIVVAFVFNTWFFLGGVPGDLAALEHEHDYPPVLKIFAQFILIPIVTVYLMILTIYLGKILVTRVWPSGWIGYLVSSVATLGILSLLLVHPIAERQENRWMATYSRWFYVALFPSIVMLLLAIGKRIGQYGVTEKRYVIVVLAVWLAVVAVFYAVSRSKNIKVIPTTLCLLALGTAFGPWGAYAVSEASQRRQLEALLERNDLLADGRIQAAPHAVAYDDRREISAKLRYLLETHGTRSIAHWFPDGVPGADSTGRDAVGVGRGRADELAGAVMGRLRLEYLGRWESDDSASFSYFAQQSERLIPISAYDYAWRIDWPLPDSAVVDGKTLWVRYDSAGAALVVRRDAATLLELPLLPLLERLRAYRIEHGRSSALPSDLMVLDGESDRLRMRIYLNVVSGYVGRAEGEVPRNVPDDAAVPGGTLRLNQLGGDAFFTLK